MSGPGPHRRELLASSLALVSLACRDAKEPADWAWFEPTTWEGRGLAEIELLPWVEGGLEDVDLPARIILYRANCELCGQHFDALREHPQAGALTLIRVPEVGESTEDVSVRSRAPEHEHRSLVPLARGYGVETPVVLLVDASGRITAVRTGI